MHTNAATYSKRSALPFEGGITSCSQHPPSTTTPKNYQRSTYLKLALKLLVWKFDGRPGEFNLMAGPRWTWVEYTLLKISNPSFPIANEWSRSFRGERRSSYDKRGGQVVGKARFANECAWPPTPRADDLRCDDKFAHSYTVMLCAHLVLASLQKRPWSWCWNRRKCAREENCRCNRWWKLNEAIVFVSIIILLNYMILALVWCFNAPSLNICLFIFLLFFSIR